MPKPSLYKPEYCDLYIAMSKEGKLPCLIAAEIGVCKRTMLYWREQHPEFKEACDLGDTWCEAVLATDGLNASLGKGTGRFSAVGFIYIMKCAFGTKSPEWKNDGYNNKIEVTTENKNLTVDQMKERLQLLLQKQGSFNLKKENIEEAVLIEQEQPKH